MICALFLLTPWATRALADELNVPDTAEISTASIDNFAMPPTAEAAYQEIVRNNASIAELEDFISSRPNEMKDQDRKYQAARQALDGALRDLLALRGKCPLKGKDEVGRKQDLQRIGQALRDLISWVKGNPAKEWSDLISAEASAKALCDPEVQAQAQVLSDAQQIDGLLKNLDEMRSQWVAQDNQKITNAKKLKAAREGLKQRLQEEATRLKQLGEKAATLTTDLKWLILILGCLSILVMLIIRTFPVELQTEWVTSGQVIQFMTVLVLLIAILILGLANILKENTLGTLLGGIGGYVLAQGVGRAAARSAVRQAARLEGPPPQTAPGKTAPHAGPTGETKQAGPSA